MSITERTGDAWGPKPPRHVDDFIWNPLPEKSPGEDYAAWMLMHFRQPAATKWKFAKFIEGRRLYCDYKGAAYRCTGASRMGDVWLATDPERTTGYDLRVAVDDCSNWRDALSGEGK